MPDVTPLPQEPQPQPQEQTVEISIPVEQTGLPVSQEAAVPPQEEIVTAAAEENTQSNPQENSEEITPEQPQSEPQGESNPQIAEENVDNIPSDNLSSLPASEEPLQPEVIQAEPVRSNAGKPCLYCKNKEKYQTLADDYVNKATLKTGERVTIPYSEELAILLNLSINTLNNWVKKIDPDTNQPEHPELIETMDKLKTIQKLRLLQRTIGRYNPTGAIFQLKANHNMMETEKKVLAGEANEPLLIEFVKERPQMETLEETANE